MSETVDDLMVALEGAIEREVRDAQMSPFERLCLDGIFRDHIRPMGLPDGASMAPGASTPPLEFLYHQAKNRIPLWQYLAGVRFRIDFVIARAPSSGVVDPTRMALYAVEGLDRARSEWKGRGGGGAPPRIDNVPVARLDAQRRLGLVARKIPALSFRLAEMVIGAEMRMPEVGKRLGLDDRTVGHRFREALIHLAGVYAILHTVDAKPRPITSVCPMPEKGMADVE